MSRLQNALEDYVSGVAEQAGRLGTAVQESVDLTGRLLQLRRRTEMYLIGAGLMIVVLFAVEIYLIIIHADKPEIIKQFSTAFGVSSFGLIGVMMKLWRDRDRVDTILVVAASLEPADLRAVLDAMLKAYFGRK